MQICFEGPSAVGKTTLSAQMAGQFTIIPEVNLLFARPANVDSHWYFNRQIDRFNRAKNAPGHVILDGDVFQPLWYQWCYGFPSEFPGLRETCKFYVKSVLEKSISFPDLYIILHATRNVLTERKLRDNTRSRSNFEKHLKLIEPQKEYFTFIKSNTEIPVYFIENKEPEECLTEIFTAIESNINTKKLENLKILRQIITWINHRNPEQ